MFHFISCVNYKIIFNSDLSFVKHAPCNTRNLGFVVYVELYTLSNSEILITYFGLNSAKAYPLQWHIANLWEYHPKGYCPLKHSHTSLSNRPGLLRAGSIELGLLVAPITTNFPLDSRPSIRVRSCATTLFSSCPPLDVPLLGHRASNSSMNKTHGPCFEAALKNKDNLHFFPILELKQLKQKFLLRKPNM